MKPSKSFKDCAPKIKTNIGKCGSIAACKVHTTSKKDLDKVYDVKSYLEKLEYPLPKGFEIKTTLRTHSNRLARIRKMCSQVRRLFPVGLSARDEILAILRKEIMHEYLFAQLSITASHPIPSFYDLCMSKKNEKKK